MDTISKSVVVTVFFIASIGIISVFVFEKDVFAIEYNNFTIKVLVLDFSIQMIG